MRIISGKSGGIVLETLPGRKTRPTTDRVKESIFNLIQFSVPNKNVLDLFSGSGALGLEAASRNAKKVFLVEKNPDCEPIINRNIKKANLEENVELHIKDSFDYLLTTNEKFDIVLLDPPYQKNIKKKAIDLLIENDLLNKNALIIVETFIKDDLSFDYDNLDLIRNREYGNSKIYILRRK